MASSNYDCSVTQGFNFKKDEQVLVGHVVALTIGGTTFTADMTLTDPIDNTKTVTAVGVISNISWGGGYAEPIMLYFQISSENKKAASILIHQNMMDTTATITFNVYDFDQKAKTYYKAFWTNDANMNGLVLKQGGELAFTVADDEGREVISPRNFAMGLGVMPQDTQQAIQMAVSNTDKFSKQWGVTVGGT
ncbi:hypothetical protein SAMN02949497_2025 [Methylomagnum ishizawai]|uniref:Uncharacterized protein n=1 Tax=Methylomagnum ishizawai TaxID=1760988 RepID=A0A1Y6D1G6_9GAMM|nr:hypothetical protein [Methylomagnum ishizawai]SMF94693.1 hypothetical protein SAMN02949497_2025 [Methylomagnum ishizawai]